jgi:anti-sigma factor RsiW
LTFSLSDAMRMAMIRTPAPESSTSTARACTDWELVLHAFFDGELNAADSLACELHLGRCQRCSGQMKDLKSMRQKLRRSAIGWAAPDALRNRIG